MYRPFATLACCGIAVRGAAIASPIVQRAREAPVQQHRAGVAAALLAPDNAPLWPPDYSRQRWPKVSPKQAALRVAAAKHLEPSSSEIWLDDGVNLTGYLANQKRDYWSSERRRALEDVWSVYSMYRVWGYEADAWAIILSARKSGPHRKTQSPVGPVEEHVTHVLQSATTADWYFLAIVLLLLVLMDVAVLHQLPETARTHVILLGFWLLVAVVFAMEVWLHIGPAGGVDWITGYLLELMFSLDNVFIVHVIFSTFETPRRLVAKALSFWVIGSMVFRCIFFLGLGETLYSLRVIPYVLGLWLVYCGTTFLTGRDDDIIDVTQTTVVRTFRSLLGGRLGEFYDEESEAIIIESRGKYCMTLLGVVILCLLTTEFFCGLDVVLTKIESVPNAYLNFSSSALAIFTIRALFFVARDVFNRYALAKYGVGLVIIFVGAEILLSHAIYVNALMSCTVITAITVISVVLSSLKEPYHKIG